MARTNNTKMSLSIILPAYNEEASVGAVVSLLVGEFPDAEVLVIDDCSTDGTSAEAQQAGARVIRHKYNMGNGASIKTGARHAQGEILVFMDADGQHAPQDVVRLLQGIADGYEMVVGARGSDTQANKRRWLGNELLNRFASLMTSQHVSDLTSGFRAVSATTFREFIHLLPNGFSYPTTSTMAYLRSGYPVLYIPISAKQRVGKSKINLVRDGIRFLVIVLKVTTLFSPMRFFFPTSLVFFLLGLGRYVFFYIATGGSFSNMAGVFFITAVLVFLIGLVSEQITAMHYGISANKDKLNS